jgi:hypothetical protein
MVPRTGTVCSVGVASTGAGALQLTKMNGSAPLHATAAVARGVVRLAEDDLAALSELR